jgi:hypothetical protein
MVHGNWEDMNVILNRDQSLNIIYLNIRSPNINFDKFCIMLDT